MTEKNKVAPTATLKGSRVDNAQWQVAVAHETLDRMLIPETEGEDYLTVLGRFLKAFEQILGIKVEFPLSGPVKYTRVHGGLIVDVAEAERLKSLSVENILLEVVPGDGDGREVYAKSVDDVRNMLSKLDEQLETANALLERQAARTRTTDELGTTTLARPWPWTFAGVESNTAGAAPSEAHGTIMGAAYDFRDAHLSGSMHEKRTAHEALDSAVRDAIRASHGQAPAAGITVEQVEDAIGLQSTAWDTIGAEKIVEAVLRLANAKAPAAGAVADLVKAAQAFVLEPGSMKKKLELEALAWGPLAAGAVVGPQYELDGLIAECERGLPFDATSLATLKRVRGSLAPMEAAVEVLRSDLKASAKEIADEYAAQLKALVTDVEAALGMLEEGEWAEHFAKTDLGNRLEAAITKLHSDLNEAPTPTLNPTLEGQWLDRLGVPEASAINVTGKSDSEALHAQLLNMLGAKDQEDAARIIAQHHARELKGSTAVAKLSRNTIRQVFLDNGFTIKDGNDDLKEYVYKAAEALLKAAHTGGV